MVGGSVGGLGLVGGWVWFSGGLEVQKDARRVEVFGLLAR